MADVGIGASPSGDEKENRLLMTDHRTDGKVERPAPSSTWDLGQRLQVIPATGKPPARLLESIMRGEERGSDRPKPPRVNVNLLHEASAHAELEILQEVAELSSIDEVDGRCAVSGSFAPGICRETAGGNEQSLVGASHHRAAKVSHR